MYTLVYERVEGWKGVGVREKKKDRKLIEDGVEREKIGSGSLVDMVPLFFVFINIYSCI